MVEHPLLHRAASHFLMQTLPRVAADMALHDLANGRNPNHNRTKCPNDHAPSRRDLTRCPCRRQRVFARPRPRTDRGASTRSGWRRALRIRRPKIRQYTLRHNQKYAEISCHYFVALSRQVVSWKFDMPQIEFGTHLVTEHSMDSKSRLLAVHRCAEPFSADRFLRT